MPIPSRLSSYLDQCGARYEVCAHDRSQTSAQTARTAHVEPHRLAKSVLCEDEHGFLLAVVPADARVSLGALGQLLGRERLRLCNEDRVASLFFDCERGAVPAIGMPWDVETIVDDDIEMGDEVYIEAGDHKQLLRMPIDHYRNIMRAARHGRFSKPMKH